MDQIKTLKLKERAFNNQSAIPITNLNIEEIVQKLDEEEEPENTIVENTCASIIIYNRNYTKEEVLPTDTQFSLINNIQFEVNKKANSQFTKEYKE